MDNKQIILKSLKKFKRDLGKNIKIDKVIFFGSRASGKPKKDSDIDLILVSEDFKGKKFRFRPLGLRNYLKLDYPIDFLCYTPKEFNKRAREITIVREAVRKGIEI